MRRFDLAPSAAEGIAAESALLRHEAHPLQTAAGFVLGSALSGAFWTATGLLVWFLT